MTPICYAAYPEDPEERRRQGCEFCTARKHCEERTKAQKVK